MKSIFFAVLIFFGAAFTQSSVAANARVIQEVALSNEPHVEINTSQGRILLELFPDKAPITVANFLMYVKSGYYQNSIFHRVIANLLIQGGGYTSSYHRKPEHAPIKNESNNGLSNLRGTISAARQAHASESAAAQFFINTVDNPQFDYRASNTQKMQGYAVFGRVVQGLETVDKIRQIKTSSVTGLGDNVPTTPVIIQSMRVIE